MNKPMQNARLGANPSKNELHAEIRQLRERVKKLDEIETYWGDDLLEAHEDWMTIKKLRDTIAGRDETIERARTMMLELINLLRGFRGNLEKS